MKYTIPHCAGCGKSYKELGYEELEDVITDGTLMEETNEFVCDICYCILVVRGLDIGTPEQLVRNIKDVRIQKMFEDRKAQIIAENLTERCEESCNADDVQPFGGRKH